MSMACHITFVKDNELVVCGLTTGHDGDHQVEARRLTGSDVLDRIMAYEAGELTDDKVIELFQELVDTGIAWSLQGSYGRTAVRLIAAGYVQDRRGEELRRHGLPDRRGEE